MKLKGLVQVFLALWLASGLILSPLQSVRVGYSAHLLDETPDAPAEEFDQPIEEEGEPEEILQPDEASVESTEAPSEVESTLEPEGSTQTTDPTPETLSIIETIESTAEVLPDDESIKHPVIEGETTILPTALAETIAPTTDVISEKSAIGTPTPEPAVMEETLLILEDPTLEVVDEYSSPVSGKILVQYDTSINLEELTSELSRHGFSVVQSDDNGILVLDVPPGDESDPTVLIESLAGIRTTAPMLEAIALDMIPNDPQFSNQTYLSMIDAAGGWEYTTGSSSVIIAVIDTGVDYTNLDFSGRLVGGYDFVNNDYDPFDDNGHGTHVAGIIAATGNNGNGIAGLDWQAKIMPIKVLDASGSGSDLNVYYGILYAVDNGASIINLSLALDSYSALVAAAVDYANSRGVTIVAASGNTNSAVNYPAALPQVIAVGAVDNSENRAFYSNYGSALDVVAPGNNILSTEGSGLNYRTGTSMAAPQVTGLASLLKSIRPLTPDQIKTTIETTSKDLGTNGWDQFFGNGLIQVRRAIEWLMGRLKTASSRPDPEEDPIPTIIYPTITPTLTPTITPTFTPTATLFR